MGESSPIPKEVANRKASSLEVVEWVGNNLFVDPDELTPEEAPNGVAWGMLMAYRESPEHVRDFYSRFIVRTLPTQQQLAQKARYDDDGSDDQRLVDTFTEGINRKPG